MQAILHFRTHISSTCTISAEFPKIVLSLAPGGVCPVRQQLPLALTIAAGVFGCRKPRQGGGAEGNGVTALAPALRDYQRCVRRYDWALWVSVGTYLQTKAYTNWRLGCEPCFLLPLVPFTPPLSPLNILFRGSHPARPLMHGGSGPQVSTGM